jgi:hypothetical protein
MTLPTPQEVVVESGNPVIILTISPLPPTEARASWHGPGISARQEVSISEHEKQSMQHVITTIGPFVLAFGIVFFLMFLWEPPFLPEELGAGFRMIPAPLLTFGAAMVLVVTFAGSLAFVVKQMDESVPFARLCAQATAIGESPNWVPLRDSFEMAQIRSECHAPHPPVAEVLGSPFGQALGLTLLMPFACLIVVSAYVEVVGAKWWIPALLISVVLSGCVTGMVLTSKEGWGPLDFACENVATIGRSPNWASVRSRPEMVEMRRACGLKTPPA